jgi:hypothetical protein
MQQKQGSWQVFYTYSAVSTHARRFISLVRTKLSVKERLFCAVAYLPKATVQARSGDFLLLQDWSRQYHSYCRGSGYSHHGSFSELQVSMHCKKGMLEK